LQQPAPAAEIVVGVDTHKHTHTAVALNALGARLGTMTVPASRDGYGRLEAWASSFGAVRTFGVECTGSYGAGLARALRTSGHHVLEVNRPDRGTRRRHGKDDTLDAEAAARSVDGRQRCRSPGPARSR
jgi:transposase